MKIKTLPFRNGFGMEGMGGAADTFIIGDLNSKIYHHYTYNIYCNNNNSIFNATAAVK